MTKYVYWKQYHDEPERFQITREAAMYGIGAHEKNPAARVAEMEATGRDCITQTAVYSVQKIAEAPNGKAKS